MKLKAASPPGCSFLDTATPSTRDPVAAFFAANYLTYKQPGHINIAVSVSSTDHHLTLIRPGYPITARRIFSATSSHTMCYYWKKTFTCGCNSHVFLDRCIEAARAHKNCDLATIGHVSRLLSSAILCNCLITRPYSDCLQDETPRKSYFPCFDCIVAEVKRENEQKEETKRTAEEERKREEEKARQIKIRKEQEMQVQWEREEEMRRERDRKAEMERAKRDGGPWVEAVSGKKGRGKMRGGDGGGGNRGPLPMMPISAPPVLGVKVGVGSNSPLSPKDKAATKDHANVPKNMPITNKNLDVDVGGRAGYWGPKSPVKILQKPDNKLENRADKGIKSENTAWKK
jgi:hypothetical protein